jgi:hypothetical protein
MAENRGKSVFLGTSLTPRMPEHARMNHSLELTIFFEASSSVFKTVFMSPPSPSPESSDCFLNASISLQTRENRRKN